MPSVTDTVATFASTVSVASYSCTVVAALSFTFTIAALSSSVTVEEALVLRRPLPVVDVEVEQGGCGVGGGCVAPV